MNYSLHTAWLAAVCLAFTAGCEVETVEQPIETQRPVIDEDDVYRPSPLPMDEDEVEINETEVNETEINNPAVTPVEPMQDAPGLNGPDATNNNTDVNVDATADPEPINDPALEDPALEDPTTESDQPE